MVARSGLRTHELLYEEIGIIIAEILSEKAERYEKVANISQRIFILIQNNSYRIKNWKIEKYIFFRLK